jgi:hypothetical protein
MLVLAFLALTCGCLADEPVVQLCVSQTEATQTSGSVCSGSVCPMQPKGFTNLLNITAAPNWTRGNPSWLSYQYQNNSGEIVVLQNCNARRMRQRE